jgi:deglycase
MARIAVPVAEGFEDSEFSTPFERLTSAGHEIVTIGPRAGEEVAGKHGKTHARVDARAADVDPAEFDALVIPGGQSPDRLRTDVDVVDFVRRFSESGKLVAAICHGPQLLIEADVVADRELTSWPSVRKDLENAGATWVNEAVVEDENLITSRGPDDLDPFCEAILDRLPLKIGKRHASDTIG